MVEAPKNDGRMRGCRKCGHGLVLGGLCLYVWWVIDPRLLLHAQSPGFFLRRADFLEGLRSWPGEALEGISAGLCQWYAFPWVGTLVVVACVGLVWWLTWLLLAGLRKPRPASWLAFGVVPLLLILMNHYTLPLAASLLAACVYARLAWRGSLRVLMALGLNAGVYVVAGPSSVLSACLCGLIELLVR